MFRLTYQTKYQVYNVIEEMTENITDTYIPGKKKMGTKNDLNMFGKVNISNVTVT